MTSDQVAGDIFSAAMEAEVARRVLGNRRHGMDYAVAGVDDFVEAQEVPGGASGA